METSLHRQLKSLYADRTARIEARVGSYRIDVASDDRLIEIQNGSLAAIRDKVRALLAGHRVLVVKPLVVRKVLVKGGGRGGRAPSRRLSPKRGRLLDLFDELVHFTRVFPHDRLTLDFLLVDVEEWRRPGHGRRRRWRPSDYEVEDQKLLAVHETCRLKTAADLAALVPGPVPSPFDTGDLAERLGVERWVAQRIAYCCRQTGAARPVGRRGNTWLYEWAA